MSHYQDHLENQIEEMRQELSNVQSCLRRLYVCGQMNWPEDVQSDFERICQEYGIPVR